MFGIKIPRPSPALAVAMLALLVALSGTAYAAVTLAPNSVGTAQLKTGAVTLTKIAKSAQGALKPHAWAEVSSAGTIVASKGFSSYVAHVANSGIYDLTLSKQVTNCAAIASENPNGGSITGGIAQADISSATHVAVHTEYYAAPSFYLGDENFSLVVYC